MRNIGTDGRSGLSEKYPAVARFFIEVFRIAKANKSKTTAAVTKPPCVLMRVVLGARTETQS